MAPATPRIETVVPNGPTQALVRWRGDGPGVAQIDLAGWIATGGEILAPLRSPDVFRRARPGDHGASVTWDEGEGDLSIDAHHLKMIEEAQRPFEQGFVRDWQARMGISNQEAASLFGIVPSTWSTYKAGRTIPRMLALTLQAVERDPFLLQAHYRPRRPGRPAAGQKRT